MAKGKHGKGGAAANTPAPAAEVNIKQFVFIQKINRNKLEFLFKNFGTQFIVVSVIYKLTNIFFLSFFLI